MPPRSLFALPPPLRAQLWQLEQCPQRLLRAPIAQFHSSIQLLADTFPNHYEVLEIQPNATIKDIKRYAPPIFSPPPTNTITANSSPSPKSITPTPPNLPPPYLDFMRSMKPTTSSSTLRSVNATTATMSAPSHHPLPPHILLVRTVLIPQTPQNHTPARAQRQASHGDARSSAVHRPLSIRMAAGAPKVLSVRRI